MRGAAVRAAAHWPQYWKDLALEKGTMVVSQVSESLRLVSLPPGHSVRQQTRRVTALLAAAGLPAREPQALALEQVVVRSLVAVWEELHLPGGQDGCCHALPPPQVVRCYAAEPDDEFPA